MREEGVGDGRIGEGEEESRERNERCTTYIVHCTWGSAIEEGTGYRRREESYGIVGIYKREFIERREVEERERGRC